MLAGGSPVFVRRSDPATDASPVLHLHGFAISGRYMMPTAELLADVHPTLVPDLPGFGRSPRFDTPLTVPALADSAAEILDAAEVDRATVVGNSLGCAVLAALAERHPDRVERAVMVSPAGGLHNRPLLRAIAQLAADAPREPVAMASVAVPDYLHFGMLEALRLFVAMTRFDAASALLRLDVPLLAVLGTRDPLLPPASRVRQLGRARSAPTVAAVIKGAAHAINFSHPRELASLISAFASGAPLASEVGTDGRAPVAIIVPA